MALPMMPTLTSHQRATGLSIEVTQDWDWRTSGWWIGMVAENQTSNLRGTQVSTLSLAGYPTFSPKVTSPACYERDVSLGNRCSLPSFRGESNHDEMVHKLAFAWCWGGLGVPCPSTRFEHSSFCRCWLSHSRTNASRRLRRLRLPTNWPGASHMARER